MKLAYFIIPTVQLAKVQASLARRTRHGDLFPELRKGQEFNDFFGLFGLSGSMPPLPAARSTAIHPRNQKRDESDDDLITHPLWVHASLARGRQ